MDKQHNTVIPPKDPNLDKLLKFLNSFQEMFKSAAQTYQATSSATSGDSAETALLKQIVPLVFNAAVVSLSVFGETLTEKSKTSPNLMTTITTAAGDMSTQQSLGTILQKIDLSGVDASTFLHYQALLKAVGINDISALTTRLSTITGIPDLLSAIQNIEIQNDKTSDNIKALLKVFGEQLVELFNNKDFKELEKLIDPIMRPLIVDYVKNIRFVGSARLGNFATSFISMILHATPGWICEKIILPRILGLTNTGITANSYTELLGKVVLHVVDKLEERITIDDQRRILVEQLKDTDTALKTLKAKVQGCKQAILNKSGEVDRKIQELYSYAIIIKQNGTLDTLASQQEKLKEANDKLSVIKTLLKKISPNPSVMDLRILLEALPKSTPEEYLSSMPPELMEKLEKYILDEEAKQGIMATITGTAGAAVSGLKTAGGYAVAVSSYLASWWPGSSAVPNPAPEQSSQATTVQAEIPQPIKLDELLTSLQTTIEDRVKKIDETTAKNVALKTGLEDIFQSTEQLTKLSDAKKQLLVLNELDQQIEAIQTTLHTYQHSAIRFFFARLFQRASYRDYRSISQELKSITIEKENFSQEASKQIEQAIKEEIPTQKIEEVISKITDEKKALEKKVESTFERTHASRMLRHRKEDHKREPQPRHTPTR